MITDEIKLRKQNTEILIKQMIEHFQAETGVEITEIILTYDLEVDVYEQGKGDKELKVQRGIFVKLKIDM